MKHLLWVLVLLIAGVLALGYYRDWFGFSVKSNDNSTNFNMTVDKEKVKEDKEKAKEKLDELGGKLRDEAGAVKNKISKEGENKKPNESR